MSTETKETKETKEEVKGDEESFDLEGEDVIEDTGDHPVVLTEHFARLLKSEKFADCTFVVGEGKSQKKFAAHRLILAAASPVLEAMLYPDPALSEKTDDESSIEVKLPHTDTEAFETLLRCVYTDKVDISATNISDLINVATKYQIEKIRVACADFMERDVTHENVCELFENAPKLLGDPEFGLKFIEENTEEVLKSESFLKLSKERLEVILQDEKLSTDEGQLFDAVLKWADHKAEILKKDKKDLAKDLVKYIRFPLMEVSKVASSVASSGLLDQDELLSVFQYVAVSDETKKADLKCVFSTKNRSGKKTVIVEWDPTQSFTNGLYTVSNKGRTARKTSGEGTIYILRAKQMLPSTGKHYWEIFVDNILRTSDIHIGACIPSFSWTSAWLKVSGSYYVDGQIGGAYDGSGVRRFDFPALSNNDRIGFLVDYKKKVLECYRGTGKHGKMTKMGEFTGITQPLYPVIASRPVGCQFTSM